MAAYLSSASCKAVFKGPLQRHRRLGAGAPTPQTGRLVIRASQNEVQEAIASNPLFNEQFMSVLQDSLARQGEQSLTYSAPPAEPRVSATEEVLTVALQQSKQTLMQLMAWRDQLDRQIAVQQKQVDRMEFALNKSRNDAAYLRAMKNLLHGDM